jgi:hypothetical protein
VSIGALISAAIFEDKLGIFSDIRDEPEDFFDILYLLPPIGSYLAGVFHHAENGCE